MADAALVPFALVAVTVNVYAVPVVRPETVIGEVPVPVIPPGEDVAVFPVMAEPPVALFVYATVVVETLYVPQDPTAVPVP